MVNVEKYRAIGEQKKKESDKDKKNLEWAKGFNKEAKKMYGEKMAIIKDQEREAKHKATADKRNEWVKGKLETGKNIVGRIDKTVKDASLLRRALPEMGKDALAGGKDILANLRQRAENKIGQLADRGREAFNTCSGKIERARSGAREWVNELKDTWKMRQIKKSMEKYASIGQNIGEKYGELRSQKNRDKIEKRIRRLRSVFELNLVVKGGDPADVSKSLEQGFAMAT